MSAKTGKSKDGYIMHYLVGAIIEKDGKFVMLDRSNYPYGFACVFGHVDVGETVEEALRREVKEESNLDVLEAELIFEEERKWLCSRGVRVHYNYIFKCKTEGELQLFAEEEKSIGWYTPEEIKKLTLEPAWEDWLKRSKII